MPRSRLLVPILVLLGSGPTAGQLQVQGLRDLAFGFVIGGIPTTVTPGAPNSGLFQIDAPVGTRIRLRLTLPSQLNGPGAAAMPISFSSSDAYIVETAPGSTPSSFNPQANKNYTLSNGSRAHVFLGGQVQPTTGQAAGAYIATVVLTVTIQ